MKGHGGKRSRHAPFFGIPVGSIITLRALKPGHGQKRPPSCCGHAQASGAGRQELTGASESFSPLHTLAGVLAQSGVLYYGWRVARVALDLGGVGHEGDVVATLGHVLFGVDLRAARLEHVVAVQLLRTATNGS